MANAKVNIDLTTDSHLTEMQNKWIAKLHLSNLMAWQLMETQLVVGNDFEISKNSSNM